MAYGISLIALSLIRRLADLFTDLTQILLAVIPAFAGVTLRKVSYSSRNTQHGLCHATRVWSGA